MNRILKILIFAIIVKPIVLIVLGVNLRFRHKLPQSGPAIIAANHNSHLDTFVLISLFPLSKIHKLRPVAAADYFLSNRFLAWFTLNIIGIIPLDRTKNADRETMFDACHQALDRDDILILFPEGTRGQPEKSSNLKKGIYHLIKNKPGIKIIPVMMHGLGRSLPRGEALFVPFNCDVVIGDAIISPNSANQLLEQLEESYKELKEHCITLHQ